MAFVAPVIGAIAGTVAAIGSTVVGGIALKIGGSLLLSAASSALMKRPSSVSGYSPSHSAATIQGRMVSVREATAARRMIYGQVRAGGTIIYMSALTSPGSAIPNNELHIIIVLAGHRIRSIGAVYLNGEAAIDAGGTALGRFAGKLSVEKHLGAGTAAPFPGLRAAAPDEWTDAHRLVGCPAVHVTMLYDPDVFPSGIPNIVVDVEGCDEVYDPRSATTGYSTNPALCLAHYLAHPRYGLNAQIGADDGVSTAELIAAANVCDETVARVGGGTEMRYTMNGIVSLSDIPETIIPDMLTAMAGEVVMPAGQWGIYAGAWRPATTTLTTDDLVSAGLRLETRVSRSQNFNAVRGTFVSPENDWVADDFPAYVSSVYLAEDNGEQTWADIILPFTISASMAQRLAKIHLERQRRQFSVTAAGKMAAWRVATMDVVNLDYARWGFSGKPFEVRGMSLEIGDAILPTLTLRETSPAIFDWSASEAQAYAAAPRTTLPNAFDLPPPGGLQVAEALYQTRAGVGVRAVATLTWTAAPSPFVTQYEVQVRRNGEAWAELGRVGELTFEWPDVAAGVWDFRVRSRSNLGVASGWIEATREIYGLGAEPAALSGVTLQSAGGLAVLKWTPHPDLDVQIGGAIVIRHSAATVPSWSNSVSMDRVPGATAIAVVPLKPGAYVLRAEDSTGNLGPETVLSTVGAVALNFASVGTLTEDATFTGTKTNCFLSAGTLQMSSSSQVDSWASVDAVADLDGEGGIVPTASYVFAAGLNAGAVTRMRLRSVIDLSVLNITDQMDTRTGNIDTWASIDGARGDEVDAWVDVRTTQMDPTGSPVWSGWSRADATEVAAWGVQARAQMLALDPSFNMAISQLRLVAEKVV